MVSGFGRVGKLGRGGPGIVLEGRKPIGEIAAFDELPAEIALTLVIAKLVVRDDLRVIEQGNGQGLALEPLQPAGSARTTALVIFRATDRFRLT